MRSLVAAAVLLSLGMGLLAVAGAEEPSSRAISDTLPPVAVAPAPQPSVVPQPAVAAAAQGKDSEAARIEHLRQAAEHLRAAGLDSLADHVRGLSAAAHAAQPPQAAGPRRPNEKAAKQVLLAIKMLEIDEVKMRKLGFDFSQVPLGGGTSGKGGVQTPWGTMDVIGPGANLPGVVEALRANGLARVLSEPTIVTETGRPAHLRIGGEVPLWNLGPDGQPVQHFEPCGTAIDFVPNLVYNGNLRLDLRCEHSEVDSTKTATVAAGKKNPGIRKWTVDTGVEMKPGQTLVVTRHAPPAQGDAKTPPGPTTLLLVTPQVVETMAALPSPEQPHRR